MARWVIDQRHPTDTWPRAAAILLRQHLELALAEHWRNGRYPTMADASLRSQLIALPSFVGDADLATRVRHVWFRLTRACHDGTYDLQPTASQLRGWADIVEAFEMATAVFPVEQLASGG